MHPIAEVDYTPPNSDRAHRDYTSAGASIVAYKADLELLSLIHTHCTIEDIQRLLRKAKRRAETPAKVIIGADDKDTLVNTNLLGALDAGFVGRDEVFELLRNAEENGDQHFFFYRRKGRPRVDDLTVEMVGKTLLGKEWETKVPTIATVEGDYVIADLRTADSGKGDWILKLYGVDVQTRYGKLKVIEGKKYLPINEMPIRVVLVAHWRQPGLLELRVRRDESRRRILSWQKLLWDKIGKVVSHNELQAWDLKDARRNLIAEEEEHSSVYSTRDTRFFDEKHDARASFEGHADAYDLFEKVEYREAIEKLIKAGDVCTHLGIKWLQVEKQATPSREIQVILLGERSPNEMVIIGHCEPADVDYITKQLRTFSR